ncbi:MAG: SAM-dependent chlorinase/fluorinase [Marinilabiliales bacterium]|nr:SAM-dependent chlorinase/fluorinase [Marinilabiliales bacterium]
MPAGIPPLNIMHGAFVIRNTFSHYPEGTIHLVFVSSEGSGESAASACESTRDTGSSGLITAFST